MKIILHSNAPWMPTGYGQQAGLLGDSLHGHGHEVVFSAFCGLEGPPVAWHGMKVVSAVLAGDLLGTRMLAAHARAERPDLVLTLCDIWGLDAPSLTGLPVACWMPVDCRPLSAADHAHLTATGAVPIAMSRHGETMLRDAGFDPLYVPHSVHPAYLEPRDRDAAREALGVTGLFAIGINAANKDPYRKGLPEQFEAFARFHANHPDTVLLVHSRIAEPGGLDLDALARRLGIAEAVRFSDQPSLLSGQLDEAWLAGWYTALDVYSGCSYGEGFGLPILEAQACGTPVVVTNASAMTELSTPMQQVAGEPFWNPVHQAWWTKPYIAYIEAGYASRLTTIRRAPDAAAADRDRAREFAARYAPDQIALQWPAVLDQVAERIAARPVGASSDPGEAAAALWAGWEHGKLAWDIGANTGQSIPQLHNLFDQVVAFEPAAESYDAIKAVYGLDWPQWLTVAQLAVSDHDGTLTTAVRDRSIAAGELTAVSVAGDLPWGELTGTREVSCITVDTLAGGYGTPDFVKVDTEGHEAQVLAGATRLLAAGATRWLIEFHTAALHAECARILAGAGYAVETVRHPHYPPGSPLWYQHGWIRATPIRQEHP